MERNGIYQIGGQDVTVVGPDILVGQPAPEFTVEDMNWATIHGLEDTQGKVRIIGSLPSFNTSVCDRETRRFNQEAAALGPGIAILMISMDLPYTLKNWCAAAGVDQVTTLSDHQSADFAMKYGVLVKERRILRRAIFVVDGQRRVAYVAYMPASSVEPNYADVLAAAKAAL
jgi:thiol peroxidase